MGFVRTLNPLSQTSSTLVLCPSNSRLVGSTSSLQYSIDVQMFDSFVACQIYAKDGICVGDHTPSTHRSSTLRITAPYYVIMQRVALVVGIR